MKSYIVRHKQTKLPFNTKVYSQLNHAKNCIQYHRLIDYEIVELETTATGIVLQPIKDESGNYPQYNKFKWISIDENN